MATFLTISVFTLLGLLLVGGFFSFRYYKSFKGKLDKKEQEIDKKDEELVKAYDELEDFYTLCDHRVGLWSTRKPVGYGLSRDFDVEVIISDICEGRCKIKIIEVIEKEGRWESYEDNFKKEFDGQWVDMNEVKELSNSKILTREKRMSKLLDN